MPVKVTTLLFRRFAYVSGLFLLLSTLLLVAFLSWNLFNKVQSSFSAELQNTSSIVSRAYSLGDLITLRADLESVARLGNWSYGSFKNVEGEPLWEHRIKESSDPNGFSSDDGSILPLFISKKYWKRFFYLHEERTVRSAEGARIGVLTVSKEAFELWTNQVSEIIVITAAFSIFWLSYLIISWKISKSILHPVETISDDLRKEANRVELMLKSDPSLSDLANVRIWFKQVADSWVRANRNAVIHAKMAAVGELAAQVSHDIRSPLSALNMILGTLDQLPEEKRQLIKNATQRINDIANGLLHKGKEVSGASIHATQLDVERSIEPIMLISLLDSIVSEKRIQFRNRMEVEIHSDLNNGYGLFSIVDVADLSRVISNLVNNSIEAFSGPGQVTVLLEPTSTQVMIKVQDNGKGIPPEVLARLGERGVTHGKNNTESGSGLGVYHARKAIEESGGTFKIESEIGVGTTVIITLPKVAPPSWFVESITLNPGQTVVSVDDDPTIHQIWSGRIKSSLFDSTSGSPSIKHLTFSSLENFENWVKSQSGIDRNEILYLVDYEFLGQSGNGLETIGRLQIQNHAILVSSHVQEANIQSLAKRLKLRMIPKSLAPFVPIEITSVSRQQIVIL